MLWGEAAPLRSHRSCLPPGAANCVRANWRPESRPANVHNVHNAHDPKIGRLRPLAAGLFRSFGSTLECKARQPDSQTGGDSSSRRKGRWHWLLASAQQLSCKAATQEQVKVLLPATTGCSNCKATCTGRQNKNAGSRVQVPGPCKTWATATACYCILPLFGRVSEAVGHESNH